MGIEIKGVRDFLNISSRKIIVYYFIKKPKQDKREHNSRDYNDD